MKRHQWEPIIAGLPLGLTAPECAAKLGHPIPVVRFWLKKLGYSAADSRKQPKSEAWKAKIRKADPSKFDWSLKNHLIGQAHGISRERVRQLRKVYSMAQS